MSRLLEFIDDPNKHQGYATTGLGLAAMIGSIVVPAQYREIFHSYQEMVNLDVSVGLSGYLIMLKGLTEVCCFMERQNRNKDEEQSAPVEDTEG